MLRENTGVVFLEATIWITEEEHEEVSVVCLKQGGESCNEKYECGSTSVDVERKTCCTDATWSGIRAKRRKRRNTLILNYALLLFSI